MPLHSRSDHSPPFGQCGRGNLPKDRFHRKRNGYRGCPLLESTQFQARSLPGRPSYEQACQGCLCKYLFGPNLQTFNLLWTGLTESDI